MGFFNQLAGSFNKAAKDLSSKAQDFSDGVRIKSKVSDAENLVRSTYAAIGEAYVLAHGNDEDCEFAEQIRIIREAQDSIAHYREELVKLSGGAICPKCGTQVSRDVRFCPKCGTRILTPQSEEEEEQARAHGRRVCTVCGEELEEGAVYCPSCGAPADENVCSFEDDEEDTQNTQTPETTPEDYAD